MDVLILASSSTSALERRRGPLKIHTFILLLGQLALVFHFTTIFYYLF